MVGVGLVDIKEQNGLFIIYDKEFEREFIGFTRDQVLLQHEIFKKARKEKG